MEIQTNMTYGTEGYYHFKGWFFVISQDGVYPLTRKALHRKRSGREFRRIYNEFNHLDFVIREKYKVDPNIFRNKSVKMRASSNILPKVSKWSSFIAFLHYVGQMARRSLPF